MSGEGVPGALPTAVPMGLQCTIVAARWHHTRMERLIAGAQRASAEVGALCRVVRVTGAFELPVVCQRATAVSDVVIALGVVVRGRTPHFDYVCQGVTAGLMSVGLSTGVPIGFGVLTVDTLAQADERCGGPGAVEDKGYDATCAAFESFTALAALGVAGQPEYR